MIRGRAISIALSTRQCMYQVPPQARIAPLIRPTMQLQRGMSSESWVQKITNFFYGKDEEATATKLAKDVKEVVETAKELTLQQYFKHMDKFQTMKKIGLGNALEKLVGVNLDNAQEKLVDNHKKIKEFLTELELQGTNFSLSPQRKAELQSSTGLTAQEIDQISNLFAHIQQVKKTFDKAKSEGKIPQSLDELKQMIGGVFNSATQGSSWPLGQKEGEQKEGEQKEGKQQQEYKYSGQSEGMRGNMTENLGKEGDTQTGSPFNTQRGAYGTSFGTIGNTSPYGSVGTAYPETNTNSTTYTGSKVAATQGESQSFPSGFKEGFKQSYGTGGGYSAHEKDYSKDSAKVSESKNEWKNENMSEKKDWKNENKNEWMNENMSDKKDWKNENMSDKKDWKKENKNEWMNENMSDKKDWKNDKTNEWKNEKSEKNENIYSKTYGDQNVSYGENKTYGQSKSDYAEQRRDRDPGYGPSASKETKSSYADDDGGFRVSDPEKKPFVDEKKNTYESGYSSTSAGPSPAGSVGGQQGNPFTPNQTTQTRKLAQSAVKPQQQQQPQTGAHRGSPVSNPEAYQKRVVGKDEVIRITNGMDTQEMSFEKAEPLISSGKWKIIENTKL